MKYKKIISILVCASFLAGMCACGNSAESINITESNNISEYVSENEGTENADTAADLSMWRADGAITELTAYVEDVTDENSADYIPEEDRIAVFDLDGTLVSEQFPIYVEWLVFCHRVLDDPDYEASDEMKQLAKEILTAGKNKSIPSDLEARESLLFGQAFEGMTTEEYKQYIADFLTQDADGFDNMTFGDAYFRPMVQVVSYLEANDFQIYVCSGTDRDMDRVIVSGFTDIPNYHVIGSDYYTEGEGHDGEEQMEYQLESDDEIVRDDTKIIKNVKMSKVVQMSQEMGQKPVLAFGNSTGDFSMFTYTTSDNPYKSAAFCLLPDDDEREYANPDKAADLTAGCQENGWYTISMKDDFLTMFGDDVTKDAEDLDFTNHLLDTLDQ